MITSSRIQLQSYFVGCVSHSVLSDSLHPMDCNTSGSSVCAILQARILEWVAIVSSWGSSRPRDWILVSCIAGECFTVWAAREALCCLLLSCKMRFLLLLGKEELEHFPPNFRSLFFLSFSLQSDTKYSLYSGELPLSLPTHSFIWIWLFPFLSLSLYSQRGDLSWKETLVCFFESS